MQGLGWRAGESAVSSPEDVNMYKTSRKGQVKPQSDLNLSQTSPSTARALACGFEMGNVTKISLNPLVTFLLPFLDDYRLKILRQHSNKGQYTFITGCTSQAKLSAWETPQIRFSWIFSLEKWSTALKRVRENHGNPFHSSWSQDPKLFKGRLGSIIAFALQPCQLLKCTHYDRGWMLWADSAAYQ